MSDGEIEVLETLPYSCLSKNLIYPNRDPKLTWTQNPKAVGGRLLDFKVNSL